MRYKKKREQRSKNEKGEGNRTGHVDYLVSYVLRARPLDNLLNSYLTINKLMGKKKHSAQNKARTDGRRPREISLGFWK
jgi:hypothetical protein